MEISFPRLSIIDTFPVLVFLRSSRDDLPVVLTAKSLRIRSDRSNIWTNTAAALYSKPISFNREQILSASFIQQPLYMRSKCLTVEPYMRYLRTILFCLRTHTCSTIYEYRKYRGYVLYAHLLDSYGKVDLKPRE